jgi:hypothetical protein
MNRTSDKQAQTIVMSCWKIFKDHKQNEGQQSSANFDSTNIKELF